MRIVKWDTIMVEAEPGESQEEVKARISLAVDVAYTREGWATEVVKVEGFNHKGEEDGYHPDSIVYMVRVSHTYKVP